VVKLGSSLGCQAPFVSNRQLLLEITKPALPLENTFIFSILYLSLMTWRKPLGLPKMAQNIHRGAQGRPWRGRGGNRGARHGGERGDRGNFGTGEVPGAHQVLPGAGVSIILKVDQPTGNEVLGIVGQVLGRGNHPRGIKVKLQDGRVGRVQRIVDQGIAKDASEGLSSLGRNGEPDSTVTGIGSTPQAVSSSRHFADIRDDPYDYANSSTSREPINLVDYIKPSKNRKKKSGPKKPEEKEDEPNVTPTIPAEIVTCPVCGLFEGDEEAVSFHANTHFE
jgi:uncharacterized repeat protein (TIGR03833 family)